MKLRRFTELMHNVTCNLTNESTKLAKDHANDKRNNKRNEHKNGLLLEFFHTLELQCEHHDRVFRSEFSVQQKSPFFSFFGLFIADLLC